MTRMHSRLKRADFKAELEVWGDWVRELVRGVLKEIVEGDDGSLGRFEERVDFRSFRLLQASIDCVRRPD